MSEALVVMAASRGGTVGDGSAIDRRRRLWRLLASQAATPLWRGWSAVLCALAVETCDSVSGAAISIRITHDQQEVLAASNAQTRRFERIDHTLGEGPNRVVCLSGVPVHVADVSAEKLLWPDYSVAAAAAGVVGVSAFPVALGSKILGSFTVYRGKRAPDYAEWIDTAILADLSVSAVLADQEHVESLWCTSEFTCEAAVAAAALSYRLDISFDEAVSRLRREASLHHCSVHDSASHAMQRQVT